MNNIEDEYQDDESFANDQFTTQQASEEQQYEQEALKEIFADHILFETLEKDGVNVTRVHLNVQVEALREHVEHGVWFTIELGQFYPFALPSYLNVDADGTICRAKEQALYIGLLTSANEKLGNPMIYDLFLQTQEFVVQHLSERAAALEKSSAAFIREEAFLVRKTLIEENLLKSENLDTVIASSAIPDHEDDSSYYVDLVFDQSKKAVGIVQERTMPLLNIGCENLDENLVVPPITNYACIQEVFTMLDPNLAVTKIEPIMRDDIARRFETYRKKLLEQHQELKLMWHGTSSDLISSIVRSGLIKPGNRGDIHIRHGAAFGHGIYLSPRCDYSLSYCSGRLGRLFVCATLPNAKETVYYDGHTTFVAGIEHQVLPLYVISFDFGWDRAKRYLAMSQAGTIVAHKPLTDMPRFTNRFNLHHSSNVQNLHQACKDASKEAAIANARYYIDVKKFKVVDVADYDDDDDETIYFQGFGSDTFVCHETETGIQSSFPSEASYYLDEQYQDDRFNNHITIRETIWNQ